METKLSAFVFGYSGGAGSSIVNALANEPRFHKVVLFGRRKVDLKTTGDITKFTQEIIDFDKLPEYSDKFKGIDIGFYALGVSPFGVNLQTFRKICYGYTTTVAKMASENGCKHFHWMSGSLVSKDSWIAGSRIAAEVEDALKAINLPRISAYRPSLILSKENNGGMAGSVPVAIFRTLDRFRWWSVESELLGEFVVANTFRKSDQKFECLSNSEINAWGKQRQ